MEACKNVPLLSYTCEFWRFIRVHTTSHVALPPPSIQLRDPEAIAEALPSKQQKQLAPFPTLPLTCC